MRRAEAPQTILLGFSIFYISITYIIFFEMNSSRLVYVLCNNGNGLEMISLAGPIPSDQKKKK
jgi:hypothetical protein